MSPMLIDNFHAIFLDQLREFKRQRFLCDVRLVANDVEHHAHKIVLAACSPYFKELFQAKKTDDLPDVTSVYLKNCQPDCVGVVLDFAYGGGLNLGQCSAAEVLNVARACKISSLESLLVNFLDENKHSADLSTSQTADSSKKRKQQMPASRPQSNYNQSPYHWFPDGGSAGKKQRGPELKTEGVTDEIWCSTHSCLQAACRCRSPPVGTMATPGDFINFWLANAAAAFNPATNGLYNSLAAVAALANSNASAPPSSATCLPQVFVASSCNSPVFASTNTSGSPTPKLQSAESGKHGQKGVQQPANEGKLLHMTNDVLDDNLTPTEENSTPDEDPPANENEDGDAAGGDLTNPKSHKKCDDPTASFDQILTDDRDGWCRNKKFIKKTPNDGYQCTLCKKTYGRYNSVSYHVTIYHRNPPIICDHAGCSFRTREARYIHFHKFYRHDIPLPSNIDLETRRCPHCKHVAKSPAMLDKHMKRHDAGSQGTPRTAGGVVSAARTSGQPPPTLKPTRPRHRCAVCSTEFGTKAEMVQHSALCGASVEVNPLGDQREVDAHACDQCPYRTFNAGTLTQHKMFKHNADLWLNKYQCDQCNYSSPSQAKVSVHKSQKHGESVSEGASTTKADRQVDEDDEEEYCKLSIVTDEADHSDTKSLYGQVELKIDEDLNKFANFLVTTADSLSSIV